MKEGRLPASLDAMLRGEGSPRAPGLSQVGGKRSAGYLGKWQATDEGEEEDQGTSRTLWAIWLEETELIPPRATAARRRRAGR
jgi:hypothetical protein